MRGRKARDSAATSKSVRVVKKVLLATYGRHYKKRMPCVSNCKKDSALRMCGFMLPRNDDELKKSVPHFLDYSRTLRVCMLASEDKENKPLFRVISQVYLNPECGREYNSRWEISENRLDLAEQSAFLAGFEVKGPRQSPSVTQMSEKLSRMFE